RRRLGGRRPGQRRVDLRLDRVQRDDRLVQGRRDEPRGAARRGRLRARGELVVDELPRQPRLVARVGAERRHERLERHLRDVALVHGGGRLGRADRARHAERGRGLLGGRGSLGGARPGPHSPPPAAAAALGRTVRVAVLKGRQNYLCRRQLQGFVPSLLSGSFEELQPWIDSTDTGDRAELPVEPSEALWYELAVGADRCARRRCPFVSSCFAEAARARAGEAELVIANHALYFADLAAGGGVLPEHDAVVFDEA